MSQRENDLRAAWSAANRHAYSRIDENGRHSIAGLSAKLALGQLPEWQIVRVLAYWSWWESVWAEYERVRIHIGQGYRGIYDPAAVGACPFDIWQIIKE